MTRWLVRCAEAVFVVVGALLFLSGCEPGPPVFSVDVATDSVDVDPGDGHCADAGGTCSLRAAVMEASSLAGAEEIVLTDGETYMLSIAGADQGYVGSAGDLDPIGTMNIVGDATIDAGGIDRVFDVYPTPGVLTIDGPDLTGGAATNGPALMAQAPGEVRLLRSNVFGNTGSGTGAVAFFSGTHNVLSSSFYDNATDAHLAEFGSTVDLVNVTMLRNGDGPVALRSDPTSSANIRSSTLMGGEAFVDIAGTLTIDHSIVSGCTNPATTSLGFNIDVGDSCGFANPTDVHATDPMLGPLSDNGGSVRTMLPTNGSPAVEGGAPAAACTAFGWDARDVVRPGGPACDIGAVELGEGTDCATQNFVPGADLRQCNLAGLDLQGIVIPFADLTGADLTGANLSGADLFGTTSLSADFSGADLTGADFGSADLTGASITGAAVEATDFSTTVFDGVRSGGLTGNPAPLGAYRIVAGYLLGPRVDLSFEDLTGFGAPFSSLPGANLRGATLVGADLYDSDLTGADLTGADLSGLDLYDADLTDAILTGATVQGTELSLVQLHGVRSGGLVGVPLPLPAPYVLTGGFIVGPAVDLDGADLGAVALDGVSSGEITGTPLSLPPGFVLEGGYLVGPGARLTGADLADADLSAASLVRVRSGGITGTPALPSPYVLLGGYILGPGVDLFGADLGILDLSTTDLTGVRSGSVTGNPTLPAGWVLWNGYLIGAGADLTGVDLSGANLSGVDLTGVILDRVRSGGITGTPVALPNGWHLTATSGHLVGPRADLDGATIPDPLGFTLTDATFVGADLTGADLFGALIQGTDFTGATFTDIKSGGVGGSPATLPPGFQLTGGYLIGPGADLSFAVLPFDLTGANLAGTTLSATDLSGATLAGVRSGGITGTAPVLPAGWALRANYLGSGYLVGPGADLSNAVLVSANLRNTNLSNAVLSAADLSGADLRSATITGASFGGAVLTNLRSGDLIGTPALLPPYWARKGNFLVGPTANLTGANLTSVNLTNLTLTNANLTNANLTTANLSGSALGGATLTGAVVAGTRSGGITGTPAGLPTDVVLRSGYLVGPNVSLQGAILAGADLSGVRSGGIVGVPTSLPPGCVLSLGYLGGPRVVLAGANLTGVNFSAADLYGVVSSPITGIPTALPPGVVLTGSRLVGPGVDLGGAVLPSSSQLAGVRSGGITGTPTSIPADWRLTAGYLAGPGADLRGADLNIPTGVSLINMNLTGALFAGADLTGVNFSGSAFTGATWGNANLTSADLGAANLATTDMSNTTLTGVESWGVLGNPTLPAPWKLRNGFLFGPGAIARYADLTGENLDGFNLTGADIYGMHATGVTGAPILTGTGYRMVDEKLFGPGARLPSVTVGSVDCVGGYIGDRINALSNLDLSGADLRNLVYPCGKLGNSNLTGADLSGANLTYTEMDSVTITGTNFTGASLFGSNLVRVVCCDYGDEPTLPAKFRLYHTIHGTIVLGPGLTSSAEPAPAFCSDGPTLLLEGVSAVGQDLSGSCLSVIIRDSDLSNANLRIVQWTGGYDEYSGPIGTEFDGVDLSGALIEGAVLNDSTWTDSNLTGASLAGAVLFGSTWSNTICPSGVNSDDTITLTCI